jgi:hypothetical protein
MHTQLRLALALVFFSGLIWLTSRNPNSEQEHKYLAPPPEKIEQFTFGFDESIADSLWLRWIQDSDYCQTYLKPVEYVDEKPKTNSDLVSIPRNKVCEQSWSFKMLDAVTRVTPKFWMPYLAGASTLAILVEDYEGSSVIYDRGIKQYPKDWQLLYRAAFHFQFNVKDLPKAASLLEQASANGAPAWVRSLASRLYSTAGQVELGLRALLAYREQVKDNEEAVKQVDLRIKELKAQLPNSN